MKVYLNKKLIKAVLIAATVIVVVLLLLKLVSMWESSRDAAKLEDIKPTAPPLHTPTLVPNVSVREPTDEERKALADGSLTMEDLFEDLVNDAVVCPPDDEGGVNETSPTGNDTPIHTIQPKPIQTEYERRLAEIIAEVYILREEYILTLENMYTEAEKALTELVAREHTENEVLSMVSSYMLKATELENQCDGKIDIIVEKLETLIKSNNGDMSLVDTLIETYINEKAIKKAWYIERLEEKGLVLQ